jgi:hypothetical protein
MSQALSNGKIASIHYNEAFLLSFRSCLFPNPIHHEHLLLSLVVGRLLTSSRRLLTSSRRCLTLRHGLTMLTIGGRARTRSHRRGLLLLRAVGGVLLMHYVGRMGLLRVMRLLLGVLGSALLVMVLGRVLRDVDGGRGGVMGRFRAGLVAGDCVSRERRKEEGTLEHTSF